MTARTFDDPNSIEARQALLDRRSEHKSKRHRTAKRKSRIAAAKQAKGRHKAAVNAAAKRRQHARALAYWQGERADLEGRP